MKTIDMFKKLVMNKKLEFKTHLSKSNRHQAINYGGFKLHSYGLKRNKTIRSTI
jgi:hypothetical protein